MKEYFTLEKTASIGKGDKQVAQNKIIQVLKSPTSIQAIRNRCNKKLKNVSNVYYFGGKTKSKERRNFILIKLTHKIPIMLQMTYTKLKNSRCS